MNHADKEMGTVTILERMKSSKVNQSKFFSINYYQVQVIKKFLYLYSFTFHKTFGQLRLTIKLTIKIRAITYSRLFKYSQVKGHDGSVE